MISLHLHYLPGIMCALFILTVITTYFIATSRGHVTSYFPFISDTGNFPPESCIFGQMFNILSVLMAILVYARHRYLDDIIDYYHFDVNLASKNKISTRAGLLAAFGISIAGNFQETNIFVVHVIGAGLAFGVGNVWLLFQTWLSFKMFPSIGNKTINRIRLFLVTLSSVFYHCCYVFFILAMLEFDGKDITKWNEGDGGYNYRLVSSISEWSVFVLTLGFAATFTFEMKNVCFDGVCITVHKPRQQHNVGKVEFFVQHKRNVISPSYNEDFQIFYV